MKSTPNRIDDVRRTRTELESHLIDEFVAGRLSRREFIRRGTVVGLSTPLLSLVIAACAGSDEESRPATTAPQTPAGGNLVVAIGNPNEALDPVTGQSDAAKAIFSQAGDFLVWSNPDLGLEPRLATEWTPNDDGSVWTFAIREGVTFHDGRPLTAEDVAATFNRLSDPETKSNALSVFQGVLSTGGAEATADGEVVFTLDAPNGNFPNLISSDNYNAIVLPQDYAGDWEETFIGTGPWKLDSFAFDREVVFVPNADYWDAERVPKLDRNVIRFFASEQARVIAMQGGEVDLILTFFISTGRALASDPDVELIQTRSSQHPQIHLRTDQEPFADKRVRQAMAFLLDRAEMVESLLEGTAELGNDSPFAPVFPSSPTSVAQREQDVERARSLLAEAGKGDGFKVGIFGTQRNEVPDLAVLLKNAGEAAGITIEVNVFDDVTYYDKYWLESPMGITSYIHRGVPNVFLTAPLTSDGPWNAAHFQNAEYDRLVAEYVATVDLQSQQAVATKIQELLLDETPVLVPYFSSNVAAARKGLSGVEVTAALQYDATRAGFAA